VKEENGELHLTVNVHGRENGERERNALFPLSCNPREFRKRRKNMRPARSEAKKKGEEKERGKAGKEVAHPCLPERGQGS